MDLRLFAAAIAAVLCSGRGGAGPPGPGAATGSAPERPARVPPEVTFTEHVAPLLYEHCLPCHRSGESAPFPLLEYDEVRKRARQIVEVTRSRYMPPWLPAPGPVDFVGDRSLGDEEIATFARWVEAGAPEGDPARRPPVPPAAEGWQLGEPDLVVTLAAPYVVPAEGLDLWRNFVLPIPAERTRYVQAVELRPGNKRVVHHAVMKTDRTSSSRDLDAQDEEPGFAGMDMGLSESPGGQFLGWTPGKVPSRSAEGLAWTLEPGTDLVVQLHLVPTGKPEPIQVSVGFFFTDSPPTRKPLVLRLRNDDIDIPPGASEHVVEDAVTLPAAISVSLVYPHAHYLGKRIEVFAELPAGEHLDLLRIEDWDFNWQDEYRYETPVRLPEGTRLVMRTTFDNSAQNPRNPRVPPTRVRFGNRSLDEMATLTLQVLTDGVEARRAVLEAVSRHRVEQYPGYWNARLNLGAILAEQGKFEEAATHLRAGLALEPRSIELHMNLGGVLARLNERAEAMGHFEEALRLSPGNPRVLSNLALLKSSLGRWDEAAKHHQALLAANPRDAEAQRGLGTALFHLQRLDEAAACFEKALALDPRDFQSHYQLGRLLFRQRRLEEATKAFRAGLAIHPLPEAHADLARVYTALGQQSEAARHLEEARRLAGQKSR